ncbi:cyclic AMP-responsive element-binding protein 3 [Ara ararauna]
MSSPDELAILADDDLFEFLLKEGCFMPDISVEDNVLLEDWGLPDPEPLDKDMDDFITSILNPFQNGASTLQDYLPADEDIGIPEDQLQLLNFVNDFGFSDFSFSDFAGSEVAGSEVAGSEAAGSEAAGSEAAGSEGAGSEGVGSEAAGSEAAGSEAVGSEAAGSEAAGSEVAGSEVAGTDPASDPQNLEVVQVDHNYSIHWDWSLLQNIASELADMAEENMSIDVNNWQREEGTSTALVPTSGFPVPAPVDAIPQAESAITMGASFPELVLTEEQKQLQIAEDFTYLPLTQVKDQLTKKVRRKVRNRRSTHNIYRRNKRNMSNLENKSLFGQSRKLQACVNLSSNRTAVAKTYMTVHGFRPSPVVPI